MAGCRNLFWGALWTPRASDFPSPLLTHSSHSLTHSLILPQHTPAPQIDTLSIEEVDELARKPDSIVISIYMNLNLDVMLQKMWDYLGLIRIYTKRRGQAPDLLEPIVLSSERHGLSIETATTSISKELLGIFNFALVWGRSTKYNPQRVGLSHQLMDEDVLQIVTKTVAQQKRSKDYQERVEAANAQILKDRKKKRLAGGGVKLSNATKGTGKG